MVAIKRAKNLKFIQEWNRSIILNTIRHSGPISRMEIAKKQGLSPTTVTSAVHDLMEMGLVKESGVGKSSGGRKPILLQFQPDSLSVICIAVGHTSISMAEMNLEAGVKQKRTVPVGGRTGEELVDHLLQSVELFLRSDGYAGISITVPGIVDAENGIVRYNERLKLRDVPIKKLMEERTQLQTCLENDTNAIVLAEKYYGSYKDCENLLYIMIDDGIGAGIILRDSLYRGRNGGAGEFGHTSIDRSGIPCNCGNRGCLEHYAGWLGLYARILAYIHRGRITQMLELAGGDPMAITPDHFLIALNLGDELAEELLEEMAVALSVGISNILNILDPDAVILGGELAQGNERLLTKVNAQIAVENIHGAKDDILVLPASLKGDYALTGAAAVILQEIFRVPG
ncbi:putative NBD/HSP70 family sugar kinase [Melghirimyces profundicolus]|uniref:Putative NBD/HSP70 family sugar kinase n=1 Tax=Melghirimyces profundicolus TaxID=1242148 RepID=A0A2T6BQX1_9BACL|nr:ROK family transcriptional regulator [Melghirimyces profundicolus]PTX58483.1 putative NBD/HSP70 family sugar kinase [Melghirimyces profundicolus]